MGSEAIQSFMSAYSEPEENASTKAKKDEKRANKQKHEDRQQMNLDVFLSDEPENFPSAPAPEKEDQTAPTGDKEERPNTDAGKRIPAAEVAKILLCSREELERITELFIEYLTVVKNSTGEIFYNRFDIERIRQIMNQYAESRFSDQQMLLYADSKYNKPFDPSSMETNLPEQINTDMRGLMKEFEIGLRSYLRPLLQMINENMDTTKKELSVQSSLIKEQKKLIAGQGDMISILKTRTDNDHKEILEIKEKQKEYSDSITQVIKSTHGEMRKTISDLSEHVKSSEGNTEDKEFYKALEKIEQSLSEQQRLLTDMSIREDSSDNNDTSERLTQLEEEITEYEQKNKKLESVLTAIAAESDNKSDALEEKDRQILSLTNELNILRNQVYGQPAPAGSYAGQPAMQQATLPPYDNPRRMGRAPTNVQMKAPTEAPQKKKRKLFGFF